MRYQEHHAFIWSNEKGMKDIGNLARGDSRIEPVSFAYAVNNGGQVVGESTALLIRTLAGTRAFLWSAEHDI
jgi:probable HAF family extracellular repeat protein